MSDKVSKFTENNPNGYPWDDEQFKGDKNKWAHWWLKFHYLHHAMNDDDIETEVFCREMMKTKKAYNAAQSRISDLEDHIDLMKDEFDRISVLTDNIEIKHLCDRAVSTTQQRVPIITQRDNLEKENTKLKGLLDDVTTMLKNKRCDITESGGSRLCGECWRCNILAKLQEVKGE